MWRRVSTWPWYTDNSKDKETALLQHVQIDLYPPSACKEVSALKHKGHHKKKTEFEKEACEIEFGKNVLGEGRWETPKVRGFKVAEIWWNFGSKIR